MFYVLKHHEGIDGVCYSPGHTVIITTDTGKQLILTMKEAENE
jgi:hypothetical protein